ncbi:MAG: trigger factor [Bdellovibrio sp.]
MKSAIENLSDLERKLNVNIPADLVSESFARVYKNLQREAHLKGFRPGKAPLSVVKSAYAGKAAQEVLQDLVSKAWSEAIRQHNLRPVNDPEFEFSAPDEGKEFDFSVLFEVRPEVKLQKIEALVVEKEKFKFDEASVDRVFDNMRQAKATEVDVLEDRPAQKGDISVIHFEGFADSQPLENGKSENFRLELGSNTFIEGFEEGILGMKIGDERILSLKFPSSYHVVELADKPVEFKVQLKALKAKQLPELNDEFIKSFGGNDTVESLREKIRKDLVESQQKRIEGDLRDNLLKKLVKENPVAVPKSILQEQKRALMDNAQRRMLEQGMSEAEFQDYAQKMDADFTETAGTMVQSSFLIDAIAERNNLMWTAEEFDQRVAEYSKQTGLEPAKVEEFYERPEQRQRLAYMITEEKVIKFLLESAVIREV